jgi:hypothetical protein
VSCIQRSSVFDGLKTELLSQIADISFVVKYLAGLEVESENMRNTKEIKQTTFMTGSI